MYNLDIPGWMPEYDLEIIEALAKNIPKNGLMVEIGSFAGRSSYAWSKSVDPSVKVYCIDKWDINARLSEKGMQSIDPYSEGFIPYSFTEFQKYTTDCKNIISKRGKSPEDFLDWDTDLDLVFIDDDHKTDEFEKNLEFWFHHLKPNGIISGHDFCLGRYTHVIETILNFSKSHEIPITCYGYSFVWHGRKMD